MHPLISLPVRLLGVALLLSGAAALVGCGDDGRRTSDHGSDPGPSDSGIAQDAGSEHDSSLTDAGGQGDGGAPQDGGQQGDGGGEPTDVAPPPADAAVDGGQLDPDGGAPQVPPCIEVQMVEQRLSEQLVDGPHEARVELAGGSGCQRSFRLSTTAPLREDLPANPRLVEELPGWPSLQSGSALFDGLYALALEEVRQNSVDSISDGAFDEGREMPCPPGGCFETGLRWTYVWTRDISYSVHLGLAALDPTRARNSLEFKLSAPRGDSGDQLLQIVQDTGSGGSYPVSSDRVVWALGARALLPFLHGEERAAFARRAFTALANTAEHDRLVVHDPADGLYRGEQSFLDWREQSYPSWTAADTVHLGMSKALSTNAGHLALLSAAAELAGELGEVEAQQRYAQWAEQLREAIRRELWLPEDGQYSTYQTTYLDPAPVRRYDLLGSALAILLDVATPEQARAMVSGYPTLPAGPPVLWPQQKETPIYHNRAIWPFVTAYWARAARRAGNAEAAAHAVESLVRGAALNLSNMENLELVSGAAWEDDGPYSGPVVNSQRQLWSVAGYVSLVHHVLLGLETSPAQGIRFAPFVPRRLRHTLLGATDELVLNGFPYGGRRLHVVVRLPPPQPDGDTAGGAYGIGSIRLNGQELGDRFFTADDLAAEGPSLLEIELLADGGQGGAEPADFRLVGPELIADYRNLFGPLSPRISGVAERDGKLQVDFDPAGESSEQLAFAVYRDGELVAADLPGTTRSWTDPDTAGPGSPSHCYAIEARYLSSGNRSQHSPPWCYWGPGYERARTVPAEQLDNVGGRGVHNHGRFHYEAWGDEGHTLTLPSFTPASSGPHLLQVSAGNGAGPISTGITCAVKRIEVFEADGGPPVARGVLLMPHLGSWERWADSSFVPVELEAGRSYRIVIGGGPEAINMSHFGHFTHYTAGLGGSGGEFNRVNIAELKVLALTGE